MPENLDKKVSRLVLSANQVPKVTSTLIEKLDLRTSSSNYSIAQLGESALKLDMDNIHQVIDTLGNETYAFRVLVNLPNPKVFYNLVLKYDADGNTGRPFLLRYEMEDAFYKEYLLTGSMENFRGKMRRIYLTDVGYSNPKYGKAPGWQFDFVDDGPGGFGDELPGIEGEPCPDEEDLNSGGGSNDDGNPPLPPPAGNGCLTYLVLTKYYSVVCDIDGSNCGEPTLVDTVVSVITECSGSGGPSANTIEICQIEEEEVPIVRPVPFSVISGVKNLIVDPCIKQYVNSAINDLLSNQLLEQLKDGLGLIGEGEFELEVIEAGDLSGTYTDADTRVTNPYIIEIAFNPDLANSSGEYIVATLYHEILHAVIDFQYIKREFHDSTYSSYDLDRLEEFISNGMNIQDAHHMLMYNDYMPELRSAIVEVFPSLSQVDLEALSLAGIQPLNASQSLINESYRNGSKGVSCN